MPHQTPSPQTSIHTSALLEVTVLHPRDVAAANAGGADRLSLLAPSADGGRSPDPALVSAVVRETDLPVRVTLRDGEGLEVSPEKFRRLVDLGRTFAELGASGFTLGFLDRDLEIDRATCTALVTELSEVVGAWSFHSGFDAALEADRAWRDVLTLPRLDGVASAGSTRGFAVGGEELIARARANPEAARLLIACGGLTPEQVPWLVRSGVRQFSLGAEARPGGSWDKAYVDADYVRSWRMLLDDALDRSLGTPID